jgi:hypothetical protein
MSLLLARPLDVGHDGTMEIGRLEGYREMLMILGRAAGLSSLALATMASGSSCYSCTTHDDCATVDELLATRDAGTADSASAGAAGTPSELAKNLASAKMWDGTSCPGPEQYRAIVQLKFASRYLGSTLSAKDLSNGKCCYHVQESDCGEGGRPFLVHGQPRVATLTGTDASRPEPHAALAQSWLADALMEHASVAAFARLSLQLLSLGAPAELVRDAQLASLDELVHADFCFEMASHHAGSQLRPGPLHVTGALDDLSLSGLVQSNLLEGCIGETLAAEQLRRRAELVCDLKLKAALLEIAEDETRHAALAFRILAWCRDVAPELTREVVQRLLADEQQSEHEAWRHVLSPLLSALS